MKTKLRKQILPFLMSLVMIFSAIAGVIPAMAQEISLQDELLEKEPEEDFYYKIIFEDGILRLQLNPQKVYEVLQEEGLSKESLLKFVPEDVGAALKKGSDLSIEDVRTLVSNYISPAELKELIPTDLLKKYFDLETITEMIAIDDLLSVVSLDELLKGVDESAIAALITPNVLDLLLENQKATDAVLNEAFVKTLLNTDGFVDEILKTPGLKEKLAALVTKEVVDNIQLTHPNITDVVIAEVDSSDLAKIFDSTEGTTALKNYFANHKTEVSAFLTNPDIIKRLKNDLVHLDEVHDLLLKKDVVKELLDPTTGIITKSDVRALFTDDQLKAMISSDVITATIRTDGFIDKVSTDTALLSKIATEALITELANGGYLNGLVDPADFVPASTDWDLLKSALGITNAEQTALGDALFDETDVELFIEEYTQANGYEPSEEEIFAHFKSSITVNDIFSFLNNPANITSTDLATLKEKFSFSNLFDKQIIDQNSVMNHDKVKNAIKALLNKEGPARDLIIDSITANPSLAVSDYWEYVDFETLVDTIDTQKIIDLVNADEELYESIVAIVVKTENTDKFIAIFNSALSDEICLTILQNHSDVVLDEFTVDELLTYFDRDELVDEVVSTFGGYYAFIEKKYVSEEVVITAIGGYETLLNYLDLGVVSSIVLDMVDPSIPLNYVNFNDAVTAAGGYGKFFAFYTNEELQAIVTAIGTDKLQAFLTDSGILTKLDYKTILPDLLAKMKANGSYNALLEKLKATLLDLLTKEISSAYINDTEIFHNGAFDFQATMAALLQSIPDVQHFLDMEEGDALAQWILRVKLTQREEPITLGFVIEFIGDFSELQSLVEQRGANLAFDISDDMDVTVSATLPTVVADLYQTLLLSDRLSETLKIKLLTAPQTMMLRELSDFLLEISDEDLQAIADTVYEKADALRSKAYDKLDSTLGANAEKLKAAKEKVDAILEVLQNLEKLKRARATVAALIDRIPAEFASRSVESLYQSESVFRLDGEFEVDFYDRAMALLQKANLSENMAQAALLFFDNDLSIEGTMDVSVKASGIYRLTVVDEAEQQHVFYLPAGFDLTMIADLFPEIATAFKDVSVMPAKDTRLGVAIEHAVNFWLRFPDGSVELLETVSYYLGDTSIAIPEIPEREGFRAPLKWTNFTLGSAKEIQVYADYEKLLSSTLTHNDFGVENFVVSYVPGDRVLQLPLPTTAPSGYIFVTWVIDANGNGKLDLSGTVYGVDKDIRLEQVIQTYRMMSAKTLQLGTFRLPDDLPEDFVLTDDMQILGYAELIEYEITFEYEDGTQIPTSTVVTYNISDANSAIKALFPIVSVPDGYSLDWFVGTTPWDNFALSTSYENLVVTAKFEPIQYTITFLGMNGSTVKTDNFTVTDTVIAPPVPTVTGYENGTWWVVDAEGNKVKLWDEYAIGACDVTVQAFYEPITYTVTFKDFDGSDLAVYYFNIRDKMLYDANGQEVTVSPSANLPEGYLFYGWEEYDLTSAESQEVEPIYTAKQYSITFLDHNNTTAGSFDYAAYLTPDATNFPTLTDRTAEGYTNATWYVVKVGEQEITPIKLSDYTFTYGDIVVQAMYTPIEYTVTFKDGSNEYNFYFTVERPALYDDFGNEVTVLPWIINVPNGYSASWGSYDPELLADQTVLPVFSLNWYEIVFNDGTKSTTLHFNIVEQKLYTAIDGTVVSEPEITQIAGYDREWETYNLSQPGSKTVITVDSPIEYTITFTDRDGTPIASYFFNVRDQKLYDANGNDVTAPSIPAREGYTSVWSYQLSLAGNKTVAPTDTPKQYDIYFYNHDDSIAGKVSYKTDLAPDSTKIPALINRADEGYAGATWYVVKVNGQEITPVKLSDYTFTYGEVVVKARYTPIQYTATFYNEDGSVYQKLSFTVESGLTLPEVPAKAGYIGTWNYTTLLPMHLEIHPSYTAIQYTATFVNESGEVVATLTFTVNDTALTNLPGVPAKAGFRGAWYVVSENGQELAEAVLLENYLLHDASIVVAPRYTKKGVDDADPDTQSPIGGDDGSDDSSKGSLAWLWWILFSLLLIFLILVLLWFLNKKNLPPFTNPKIAKLAKYLRFLDFLNVFFKKETPPAIVAAAMPEEEEEEEVVEEAPIIEIVEAIDVQTADQAMSDAVAMSVVETVEVKEKAQGQKAIVNLQAINNAFSADDTVDLASLKAKKLIPAKAERVKILAEGTLDKPLTIIADAFSVQAIKMITLTGGHAIQKKYQG